MCKLVDISLQGALIQACSDATPVSGTPCQLVISLDNKKENQKCIHGIVALKI